MKKPDVLQFVIHKAEEGGYYAEAIGYSIYTQGETIDETVSNIREAVDCHFTDESDKELLRLPIIANYEVPQLV
jgi:predicted RNase H-like HicB family nuclease